MKKTGKLELQPTADLNRAMARLTDALYRSSIIHLMLDARLNYTLQISIFNLENNIRQHSRYSYWLRAGRPRGRSSGPGRVQEF
jgi:hypothetical protein